MMFGLGGLCDWRGCRLAYWNAGWEAAANCALQVRARDPVIFEGVDVLAGGENLVALGLEQLKKLPAFIGRRKEIHETYDRMLADLNWLQLPPEIPDHAQSSYYFYWLQTAARVRDRLAKYLREHDVYTTFRYYPLHWVKLYDSTGALPNAEKSAQETLCIPIHQSLTDAEVAKICDAVKSFGKLL